MDKAAIVPLPSRQIFSILKGSIGRRVTYLHLLACSASNEKIEMSFEIATGLL